MSNSEVSPAPVAVVTGANSGIGRATALHLSSIGHRVVGTVRSAARAEKLLTKADEAGVTIELVELDIADDESVRAGVEQIFSITGRVDTLVNNAGVGGNAVVEEATPAHLAEVFNVDAIGAIRCTQAVLPHMRERGSGNIVNVTSVAGRLAALAQAPYVAAKWALEGLSEELAQEVAPFGVRVVIVEPGVTQSSIFGKNTDMPNETGAYDTHYRRMFNFYAAGMAGATPASEVGRVIEEAITTDQPKLRWPVSWGGPELSAMHDRVDDQDWIALGAIEDDAEYVERFGQLFGVDISS